MSSMALSGIGTPVISLMCAMALPLAIAFTSAHFCWNSGLSACSRSPCSTMQPRSF